MCGIVGVLSLREQGLTDGEARALHNLAVANIVRGEDGTGVFYRTAKEPKETEAYAYWYKKPVSAGELLGRLEAEHTFEGTRFSVVHNRAATIGGRTEENTHPFCYGSVIGVHNGTIHGWRSLPGIDKATMDSQAVFEALSAADPDEDSVTEVLDACDLGAYSLVWYDNRVKALRFARNLQRPMCMAVTDRAVWFASELDMLEWGVRRAKQTILESWNNDDDVLLTLPVDGSPAYAVKYTPSMPTHGGSGRGFCSAGLSGRGGLAAAWDSASDDPYYGGRYNTASYSTEPEATPPMLLLTENDLLPETPGASNKARGNMYAVVEQLSGIDLLRYDSSNTDLVEGIYRNIKSEIADQLHTDSYYVSEKVQNAFVRPNITFWDRAKKRAYGYVEYLGYTMPIFVDLDGSSEAVLNKMTGALLGSDAQSVTLPSAAIDGIILYSNGAFGFSLSYYEGLGDSDIIRVNAKIDNKFVTDNITLFGRLHPHREASRPDFRPDWEAGWGTNDYYAEDEDDE